MMRGRCQLDRGLPGRAVEYAGTSVAGQSRSCRELLENHCEVEKERRNGTEEDRFGVIGGLGCHIKGLQPSPAVRGPYRGNRN